MGLDGFSMGNLGLNAGLTSAQMANQAEQIAQRDSEIKIKTVEEAAENNGVRRKKEESENKKQFNGSKEENDEDDSDEEENESENTKLRIITEKDLEKNPKEFSIRINPRSGKVELFSIKDKKVLESISPEDLMYLISKLDSASGVLVNKNI